MPKFGNEIKKILKIDSERFVVDLEFKDRSKGRVDLSFLFASPQGLAKEILVGNLFARCFVESGSLAWPNGYELCPDAIRQWIQERKKTAKLAS